jgi:hypothetical protein
VTKNVGYSSNKMKFSSLLIILSTSILQSCLNTNQTNSQVEEVSSYEDNNPLIDFWGSFDFKDTLKIKNPDYGEQYFVNYINLFPQYSLAEISNSIDFILLKSANDIHVQNIFIELYDKYLYNVNSPFYNEEYYKLVLQSLINQDNINVNDKIRYKLRLQIALKNNVGSIAENFSYFQGGKTRELHELNDRNIILFFYTPGCSSCEKSIKILKSRMDTSENLHILAIYPDGDLGMWNDYKINIPKHWINGIDREKEIINKGLYDLKASPTIYLLDKDKKVLLKDTSVEELLIYLNSNKK